MLASLFCLLLASAPVPTMELRAGAAEPGVEVILEVSGLVAPSRPKAGLFLFGRLGTAARSLRALLLRSTDGGAHWTEVLPTVEEVDRHLS